MRPKRQGDRTDELRAEVRRLRYQNAVLVNSLDWARATFRLIGRDDYAGSVDQLQERYRLPPLDSMRDDQAIRRGPDA